MSNNSLFYFRIIKFFKISDHSTNSVKFKKFFFLVKTSINKLFLKQIFEHLFACFCLQINKVVLKKNNSINNFKIIITVTKDLNIFFPFFLKKFYGRYKISEV